eukprot:g22914.t1
MFCQELAQKTAESEAAYRAMQAADQAAYRAETERLADNFVAATMEEFMQKCNQAAEQWQLNCSLTIEIQDLCDRDGGKELVVKKFKKQMAELGFLKGVGVPYVFLHGVRYPKDNISSQQDRRHMGGSGATSALPGHGEVGAIQEGLRPARTGIPTSEDSARNQDIQIVQRLRAC